MLHRLPALYELEYGNSLTTRRTPRSSPGITNISRTCGLPRQPSCTENPETRCSASGSPPKNVEVSDEGAITESLFPQATLAGIIPSISDCRIRCAPAA